MTDEHHTQILKNHNLSVTAARLAILQTIEKYPHADADMILRQARKKAGTLSKQAVYDNLHALTEKGILRVIQPMGSPALYETRICDNHHHIVCRSCNATMDIDCVAGRRPCLKPEESHGFILEEAEVIFWGTCPACQKINAKKENP